MGTSRDQWAFKHLFLCHQQSLSRRAARLARGQLEAEDLYQDTIERAWRTFHRIRHGENPRGWLLRIMFNLFVDDRRRRQKRRERPLMALGEVAAPEPYEVVPWEMVTDRDLSRAMTLLPRAHREILRLNVVERRSYKEIARMLHIPLATVGSRLHRARRHMREALQNPCVPSPRSGRRGEAGRFLPSVKSPQRGCRPVLIPTPQRNLESAVGTT